MKFGPPVPIPTRKKISNRIRYFAKQVVLGGLPFHVPVVVDPAALEGECYPNVQCKVSRDGGSAQCGWAFWEIPPWEIQVEFHAVWRSPEGSLQDITPPLHGGPEILFLPDPTRVYEGKNVASYHFPYTDSEISREYVKIADEQSSLIHPPGEIHTPQMVVDPVKMNVVSEKMIRLFMRAREE